VAGSVPPRAASTAARVRVIQAVKASARAAWSASVGIRRERRRGRTDIAPFGEDLDAALGVLAERLAAVDQRRRLARLRGRLADAGGRLGPAARARHHRAALRFGSLAGRLDTLSPLAVLGRGYAVCFAEDGRTVLRDATTTRDGDTVHVRLEHGRLACTVTGREAEEAARPARRDGDG